MIPTGLRPLIGRDHELAELRRLVDEAVTGGGGALLVTGEAGVGKSALLDAVSLIARDVGAHVLRASGVEFEADIAFSGLHQLVLPLSDILPTLGGRRYDALSAAFGFTDAGGLRRVAVADATMALIRQAATTQPLLLAVDDVMWLDRSSAFVLSFVARRLADTGAALIVTSRPHQDGFFSRAGLRELALGPLDDALATDLLAAHSPELDPAVVSRLVSEACGNPLVLVELPRTLAAEQRQGNDPLPAILPLTGRLHTLFAPRIEALDATTRLLMLMAVFEGTGALSILQAAGEGPVALLDTAARAGLISLDTRRRRLAFRHPLVRATVVELANDAQRRQAHRALARAFVGDLERRAWHLAEAATGPNEEIAALVEEAAYRRLRRGDAVGAIAALVRAAELSPHRSVASRRFADAAYVGADVTGELERASRLLADAHQVDPDVGTTSLHAAIATAYLLLNSDGEVDTAHTLLAAAIESAASHPDRDDDGLVEALYTLSLVCHFGGRPELWQPFHAGVARLGAAVPLVLRLLAETYADPVSVTAPVLGQVDQVVAGLVQDGSDPARTVRVGIAAFYVDRLAGCREPLWRLARHARVGGAIGSAISALLMLAFDSLGAGRWNEAEELATEGIALCDAQRFRLFAWPGRYALALIAAGRGDVESCLAHTDALVEWGAPRGARRLVAYSLHARTLSSLGDGAFEDAYRYASAISPPGELGSHEPQALWAAMDLVEAAVRTDRRAEAAKHAAALREADTARISSRCALVAAGSAAMASPDRLAVESFERALAIEDSERWPFELARVQLAFGEALRRAGESRRARAQLDAAVDNFDRLGAKPWARRGRRELRAMGLMRRHPPDEEVPLLTAQELQIARLAASGLGNKQIAQHLYLSPRTVSSHLYRTFPKLGITSRAALRDALQALPPPDGDASGGG